MGGGGGGQGFPPVTMSMTPGYFCGKHKENEIKRTPWLFSFQPTNCKYLATANLSDSPVYSSQ